MVEDSEAKEGKTHGYTWEFFKERIELEFIPKNSDYISRCKLRDLVNATNDNLRQYVRAYFELMLEIRHMHELDRVCHFMMGLSTWAKRKLEVARLIIQSHHESERLFKCGTGQKIRVQATNSLTRRHAMKRNGIKGKTLRKGKNLNNFKVRVSNPKGISLRRGLLLKWANLRGMLVGSLKECVSIAMKWGIIPKITPNLNRRMGVPS
jgi:hypothetical protein